MFQPQILDEKLEGSTARLRLRVPGSLSFFEAHFPDWPILPGVVQLHWAERFARRLFNESGDFAGAENLKFQRLVAPDTEMTLTLKFDSQKRRLEFRYEQGDVRYSSGRLMFRDPA